MNEVILQQAVVPALSVLVGAAITWLVSRYYYRRAARELDATARELTRLSDLIVQGLEGTGLVTWTRDAAGRPVSMVYRATVAMTTAGLSSAAAGTVTPPPIQAGELSRGTED
jgi:hypothetical protein